MLFKKKKDDFVITSADSVFDEPEQKAEDIRNTTDVGGAKLGFFRTVIKFKNHIAYVPLVLTCLAMVFLTFALHTHNKAITVISTLDSAASFFMFINVLASMLSLLCYMNYQTKHASKNRKIFFSVLFYVLMVGQLFIDYYLLHMYAVDMGLATRSIYNEATNWQVELSKQWLIIHIVSLYITLVTAILEPFLQPMIGSIRIRVK